MTHAMVSLALIVTVFACSFGAELWVERKP